MTPAIPLSDNARIVMGRRYLHNETAEQRFHAIARTIASAEATREYQHRYEVMFYDLLASLKFLPNSPTIGNAGKPKGQLSACFVLPIEDTMESIFGSLRDMALIHKSGGGTGFSFSKLRPADDTVQSTQGVASGPVSFMTIYDKATDVVKQGGSRRGANMAIMHCQHPDVLDFITMKADMVTLQNFNISVAATDEFMQAVEDDASIDLLNPRDQSVVKQVPARVIFNRIIKNAWKNGDPGLFFIDRANEDNPTPHMGLYESTNPCGELPLLAYDSCNLGSIDVAKFVDGQTFDWEEFARVIKLAVRFLDNVIEVNHYPLEKIADTTHALRRIGLGVMGFADMLYKLGVAYDSEEGLAWGHQVMKFMRSVADDTSEALAEERGVYPAFDADNSNNQGRRFRNVTRLTCAPTGTLSILADCSGGIEPVFALSFKRQHRLERDDALALTVMYETNKHFLAALDSCDLHQDETQELLDHLCEGGSLSDVQGLPPLFHEVFRTAHDIDPIWHVRMQAVIQNHCDNAVSKTINLPHEATPADIADVYLTAWKMRCKGVTVYRDGSRDGQVLGFDHAKKPDPLPE